MRRLTSSELALTPTLSRDAGEGDPRARTATHRGRLALAALVVAGLFFSVAPARAQVVSIEPPPVVRRPDGCPGTARAVGPSQAPFLDGQLGVPRRACLRDELSIAGDAYLIARPADFYGNIRIGTRISGSYVVNETVSVWGSLELVRYQTLLSAVGNSYLGLGYLTVGGTVVYFREQDRSLAAYARLVLPTTTGLDRRTQPLALELGTTAEVTAAENFRFHAWVSGLTSLVLSDIAPADPRAGVRVGGGVDWVPYEAFSVVVELASGFGYRDALDFLALQGGFRFAFGDLLGVDLSVSWPFLGSEPALAAAQLAVTGRLDGHGAR